MNKKIKHYNQHKHEVQLQQLQKELANYKAMMQIIKSIEPEAKSLVDLEFRMNSKTSFTNAEMSFKAYSLDAEYSNMKALQSKCTNINANDLNSKGEFKQSFLTNLKEQYTSYYEPNELEARETLERIFQELNDIDFKYRALIGWNDYKKTIGYHSFANVNLG